jgi:N-acetylmuramoyl-L-alanine amidase
MFVRRKIFHRGFAPASPVFIVGLVAVACAAVFATISTAVAEGAGAGSITTSDIRRQAAAAQFARAEDQRAALNQKPGSKRTLSDYKLVVSTYRRVYLITPHAPEVSDALMALGELYTEMGDRFGRSYYQSAVDSYRFLIHDYPASKHAQDALLHIAQLEKDQLGDPPVATKAYEEFLRKYPRSPHRREAQEARAELALLQNGEAAAGRSGPAAASAAAPPAASGPAWRRAERSHEESSDTRESAERGTRDDAEPAAPAVRKAGVAKILSVNSNANSESTRVTIDLEDRVEFSSARIQNPERIFFDLHTSRLTPDIARKSIHVEGGLLTAVRLGQNHSGIVRVVLDVNGVKEYVASMAANPPRLVIDLFPGAAPQKARVEAGEREEVARSAPAAIDSPVRPAQTVTEPMAADRVAVDKVPVEKVSRSEASAPTASASSVQPAAKSAGAARGPNAADSTTTAAALPAPVATLPSAKSKSGKGTKPDLIQPATTAQPTRDGQATLTRALGLKIGRIVIDPGHGGHDTGTIGPTGLMEKDLCLDVALRLGKIIQQRLPGAEVVYTRSDDTFIPLEERTRIANEAKADLFISIHANSSHDHGARGIETYYLNLKGSPEAMEVAARENSTADESVHDLEDLVKKIARSEKIDESREFAADIQESLSKRIQKNYKPVKDRGVRKAPFVVLIGADMPSILTEISFLSNPADEQLLKKPEHRQRVAEGLYQGVASYLQSLNSVTMNMPKLPLKPATRSMASAAVEETRNPQ